MGEKRQKIFTVFICLQKLGNRRKAGMARVCENGGVTVYVLRLHRRAGFLKNKSKVSLNLIRERGEREETAKDWNFDEIL